LKPEEIAVISLAWKNMGEYDFPRVQSQLAQLGIRSAQTGSFDMPKNAFSKKDHITLSGIFPAKGNEASIVYVMGFDQVGIRPKLIVQERNMAFTAMTRTRGWCILTGVGDRAKALFKEMESILVNSEQITFKVPDPSTIQRNLDNLEYEKRRNKIAEAQRLMARLDRVLDSDDFKNIDPALRKRIIEKLQGDE
jgi:superfamily I DNA and RNA helicase